MLLKFLKSKNLINKILLLLFTTIFFNSQSMYQPLWSGTKSLCGNISATVSSTNFSGMLNKNNLELFAIERGKDFLSFPFNLLKINLAILNFIKKKSGYSFDISRKLAVLTQCLTNVTTSISGAIIHGLIESIKDPQINREINNFLGRSFNEFSTHFDQEGAGTKIILNFTEQLQHIFNKFINEIFGNFGDRFEEDGEGARIMKNVTRRFNEEAINIAKNLRHLVEENGELARALREGSHEVQQVLNNFIDETTNHMDDAMRQFGDAANANAEKIGETIYSKFKKSIVTTTLCMATVIISWYGAKLLYNEIERKLTQPRIIIESSFKSTFQRLKNFIFRPHINLRTMIFPQELENRLVNIIEATKSINAKIKEGKTNVKYRSLFLFGAPGTGKTMFAKELAKRSGMDYAIITGSSFFQKDAGVKEIDELFAWANKTKKGFMLIIDEADSFIIERSTLNPTDKPYYLLNHFLNYTGERNNKYMVVYCSNHEINLDYAIFRRIDDYIEIPLPAEDERYKVLWLYRDQILFDENQNSEEFVQEAKNCLTDDKLLEIAQKTAGLSNGDLEGIINNIKTDADIAPNNCLNNDIIDRNVNQAMAKLAKKLAAAAARNNKASTE